MSFPKLPPLDDLDLNMSEINNSSSQMNIKENSQAGFSASLELPGLPELDDLDNELFIDEIPSILENELENKQHKGHENDSSEDFVQVDNVESMEDIFEEELEFQKEFLPAMNQEILPTMEKSEVKDEMKMRKEPTSKIKNNNKDKGFKEIDEEFIKNFVSNIKDKIMNFKSKLFKSSEFKENKNKKINKPKQDNKVLNRLLSILKIAVIMIVIIGIIFAIISFVLKTPSSPLADISHEIKGKEVAILINNIERNGEGIELTFKNQGDISTSFFVDIEFNSKISSFKKEKFICQSDIIFLEPGKELKETMKCEDFIEADEYGIEVNLEEIK